MASSERVFELLDTPEGLPNNKNAKQLDRFKGKIEFDGVDFAYNDKDWVLKDVSFSLEGKAWRWLEQLGRGNLH